eukprot:2400540-Rhodomonas_salina.2
MSLCASGLNICRFRVCRGKKGGWRGVRTLACASRSVSFESFGAKLARTYQRTAHVSTYKHR